MSPPSYTPDHTDTWRYVVILAKMLVHALHPGLVKALSVFLPFLVIQLDMAHSTAGFIIAMEYGVHMFACPLSHLLAKRFGCRTVTTIGGFLSAVSLLAGTFSQSPISLGCSFFLTGILSSPLRQLSSETLHQYYGEYYGQVAAVTQLGTHMGNFLMPYLAMFCLEAYGLRGSLLFLGAVAFHGVAVGASLRPPRCPRRPRPSDDVELDELQPLQPRGGLADQTRIAANSKDLQPDECTEQNQTLSTTSKAIQDNIHDTLDFIKTERVFMFLMLPCQVLFDTSYCAWTVFLFSYGIAEGLPVNTSVYLVMMGSIGGVTGWLVLIAVLYKHPLATPHMLALDLGVSSIALLAYPFNSSPTYLAICSFVAGFGFYNSYSTFYGAVSVKVKTENFPKAVACSFMICGISYLISGMLTGFLYDLVGSFRGVFRIFGVSLATASLAISINLCADSSRSRDS
nr:monocarboxylate transporter 7-like [Lytechinus pictus]